MTDLEWRDAEFRDRGAFQKFRCVEGELQMEVGVHKPTLVHPRIWEWAVQEMIREFRVPVKSKASSVRVGCDSEGIGAIVSVQEITKGEHYDIPFGAIALRHRNDPGFVVANAMMEEAFSVIVARCVDVEATRGEVFVSTLIDENNRASQYMCTRAGFSFTGMDSQSPKLGMWSRMLPLPDSDPLFEF